MTKAASELDKVKDLAEVALQSLTPSMISDLAEKLVSSVETIDQVMQPETMALLYKLPEVSDSLSRSLDVVQSLEKSGSLRTLSEVAELLSSMKVSMTNQMITESVEKAIKGVEFADDMVQLGALDLVEGLTKAFHMAQEQQKHKEPPTRYQLLRSMGDPDFREGMGLMIAFLKALPSQLNK